jgi:pyrroline-5-carboxylate reductase
MKTNTIGFIGGGRITRIFLQAFKNRSVKFDTIVVYDTDTDVLNRLKQTFPEVIIADSPTQPAKLAMVILAVHPPVMMEVLNTIKSEIQPESVVLSLAPKFNISKISEALSTDSVIRMIPNATSFINKGFNPVHFHDSFSEYGKSEFMKFFSVLGDTFEVEEFKLEGYAIVSAMLPTYFWFQWQKIEEIAVKTGLSPKEASEAVSNTMKVAYGLFYQSELSHEQVIDLIPVKPIGEHEEDI